MKKHLPANGFSLAVASAAALLFGASSLFARDVREELEQRFPNVIPHELGMSGSLAPDQINITSVRGDRQHLEPGGSYLVEGTYTLVSAEINELNLFCTTRESGGPTPVQDGQRVRITKGTGRFCLYETNLPDGWLHVQFSSLHGGLYFGEMGRERTIMRDRGWSHGGGVEPLEKQHDGGSRPTAKANLALLAYLGDPVPPSADMDARYRKESLLKAFTELCRTTGFVITKLAVDDTEFPFLVYGTLDGAHSLPEKPVFEAQRGYTYGGSVRGNNGGESTFFAVNMVPSSQYPENSANACSRRLMLRLEMLADKARRDQ